MTTSNLIGYLLFGFFILSLLFFIKSKFGYNKHRYNVKKAREILSKINTFEHSAQKLNYLRKIDPFVFEEILLTAFQKKGYKIKRNKKYTGDGGIDGIIFNGKNKILIQAKRYSNLINPQHLKDFSLLVAKMNAKGYFIHTGRTSSNSFELVADSDVVILSGDKLINLLNSY